MDDVEDEADATEDATTEDVTVQEKEEEEKEEAPYAEEEDEVIEDNEEEDGADAAAAALDECFVDMEELEPEETAEGFLQPTIINQPITSPNSN